jgi:hypothetical protein
MQIRTVFAFLGCTACVDEPVSLGELDSELGCVATKIEAFSSDEDEGRLVFSPNGKLAMFHRLVDGRQTIMESHLQNGQWSPPAVASFSGQWDEIDPYIDFDGKTVFFSSFRPVPGATAPRGDADIWKVTKTASGWSAATLVPDVNTTSMELFPSTTIDGALFFNSERPGGPGAWDIYRAKPRAGGYHAPVPLPGNVNSAIWEFNPSPTPFGKVLAFASLDPDPAAPYSDVFFSVKTGTTYSHRIPAGDCVNTVEEEYHPTLDVARGRLIFVRNDPFSPFYPNGDFYEARITLRD